MVLTTQKLGSMIKNSNQDETMEKVKVKALRPFYVIEKGQRKIVEPGQEVEIEETLALELEASNKVSFDLSKQRGRLPKEEAVDPMDTVKSGKK
jgi:hypothetical protein